MKGRVRKNQDLTSTLLDIPENYRSHIVICIASFSSDKMKSHLAGHMQWLTAIIPALWNTKADESQGQEFKTTLANMIKPHLY